MEKEKLLISKVHLFDGEEERKGFWDVQIEDGKFASIDAHDPDLLEEGRKVLYGDGGFLLPGLIDLHVHLTWDGSKDPVYAMMHGTSEENLLTTVSNSLKYLACGVTTVRDLGSSYDSALHVNEAVEAGKFLGPRIIAAGQSIIMTGGHDPFHGIMIDGPWEALRAVRRQAYAGAGIIKVSATGGVYGRSSGEAVDDEELRIEELAMIADEAHRRGLMVTAHAIGEKGIRNCVEAGIDCIEHGHFLTEDLACLMKQRGISLVPTIAVYQQLAKDEDIPSYASKKAKSVVESHKNALKLALQARVLIGAGSDAGSPNTQHPALHNELAAFREYGLSCKEVLATATSNAGKILGERFKLGRIFFGFNADCMIVEENPCTDIKALSRIKAVIKAGRVVS